jgi:hypothetical protein
MQSKAMVKAIINEIKEWKWKEKEERRSKRVIEALTIIECATQRSTEKRTKAMFMWAWSPIASRDVWDQGCELAHWGMKVSTLVPLHIPKRLLKHE